MTRNQTLILMSICFLLISFGSVACSIFGFGTCPKPSVSKLFGGTYLERVPTPDGRDGRVPRLTRSDWPHKTHPYYTAPDMQMTFDKEKKTVVVKYKRQGEKVVEYWQVGKIEER